MDQDPKFRDLITRINHSRDWFGIIDARRKLRAMSYLAKHSKHYRLKREEVHGRVIKVVLEKYTKWYASTGDVCYTWEPFISHKWSDPRSRYV